MQIKQVDAVINAVTAVLGSDFIPNTTNVLNVITKEQKEEIRKTVLNDILNGNVIFNKSTVDLTAVKRYVNGMIDNHLRKSKILNGGSTYKPSRKGSKRDPQLRELNKLLKTFEPGSDNYNNVQASINARNNQIIIEKNQKQIANVRASIDTSILPDNLASMLQE